MHKVQRAKSEQIKALRRAVWSPKKTFNRAFLIYYHLSEIHPDANVQHLVKVSCPTIKEL